MDHGNCGSMNQLPAREIIGDHRKTKQKLEDILHDVIDSRICIARTTNTRRDTSSPCGQKPTCSGRKGTGCRVVGRLWRRIMKTSWSSSMKSGSWRSVSLRPLRTGLAASLMPLHCRIWSRTGRQSGFWWTYRTGRRCMTLILRGSLRMGILYGLKSGCETLAMVEKPE